MLALTLIQPWAWAIAHCGPVGWCFDNVRPLVTPVPCRGAQGLWRLPADVDAAVRGQIGEGARG